MEDKVYLVQTHLHAISGDKTQSPLLGIGKMKHFHKGNNMPCFRVKNGKVKSISCSCFSSIDFSSK